MKVKAHAVYPTNPFFPLPQFPHCRNMRTMCHQLHGCFNSAWLHQKDGTCAERLFLDFLSLDRSVSTREAHKHSRAQVQNIPNVINDYTHLDRRPSRAHYVYRSTPSRPLRPHILPPPHFSKLRWSAVQRLGIDLLYPFAIHTPPIPHVFIFISKLWFECLPELAQTNSELKPSTAFNFMFMFTRPHVGAD